MALKIQYSFWFTRFWNYILSDKRNPELVDIIVKEKDLKNDTKLEDQEKHTNEIITWTKYNVKYKNYFCCIYFIYIYEKF